MTGVSIISLCRFCLSPFTRPPAHTCRQHTRTGRRICNSRARWKEEPASLQFLLAAAITADTPALARAEPWPFPWAHSIKRDPKSQAAHSGFSSTLDFYCSACFTRANLTWTCANSEAGRQHRAAVKRWPTAGATQAASPHTSSVTQLWTTGSGIVYETQNS